MKPLKLIGVRRFGRLDVYANCDRSRMYEKLVYPKSLNGESLKIIVDLGETIEIIDQKSNKSFTSYDDAKLNAG